MKTFIYCKGAPLYDSGNDIVSKSCTDRINDTTTKNGGIPVFLDNKEVGRAVQLEKIAIDGISMLKYEAALSDLLPDTSLETFADGYAGHISGAMWINGLHPQKIQLITAKKAY